MKTLFDIGVLGVGHAKPSARAGIYRCTESLLQALSRQDADLDFCARFAGDEAAAYLASPAGAPLSGHRFHLDSLHHRLLRNASRDLQDRRLRRRVARTVWSFGARLHARLPVGSPTIPEAAFREAGIYHTPHYAHHPPRFPRHWRGTPFVTQYDVIPLLFPQFFAGEESSSMRKSFAGPMKDWHVVSISEATTRDLVAVAGLSPEQIHTVPLAADPAFFHARSTDAERAAVRSRLGLPDAPYLLTLNTLEPRKNIAAAVRAFARVADEPALRDFHLALAGAHGWKADAIFQAIEENPSVRGRIHVTGYVADQDLAPLYSGATAFLYPSFYEGFGLPPLEAMSCGTPVVCSDTSSLPEVVGDAALTVAPDDVDGLAASILRLVGDTALRDDLARRSLERAALFSWERAAREVLAAWRNASGAR